MEWKEHHYVTVVTKYVYMQPILFPKWNRKHSQHFNIDKVCTWMWRERIGWTTFVVWVAVVWLLSKKCYLNRFSWNGHWGASSSVKMSHFLEDLLASFLAFLPQTCNQGTRPESQVRDQWNTKLYQKLALLKEILSEQKGEAPQIFKLILQA